MYKRIKSAIAIAMSLGLVAVDAQAETIQLKDIVEGKYNQKVAPRMHSLKDGIHYVASDAAHTVIVKYAYNTGLPVDTLFDVNKARDCEFKKFDGYSLSENEKQLMIYTESESVYRHSFKAKFYTFEIMRNLVKPLSTGKQQSALFSPDGRMVSFVRDNNVFLKKLDYNTETAITKDGRINEIINGQADWVYEEEFAMTMSMSWSPDSKSLAFVRFDESDVKEYSIQMFKGLNPSLEGNVLYPQAFKYKYPVAGEANAKVGVYTYNVSSKVIKKMDLGIGEEDYIPRIAFTQDPTKLAVMSMNRRQNYFKLHFVNPGSGVSKVVLTDENNSYINSANMDCIEFYPTFFTFVSEKSGYRHLYQYSMTGALMRQVSKGDWDMTEYYGYDESTKSFYIQAAKESPLRREVYRIDSKGQMYTVAGKPGQSSAYFSENFDYYQLYFTSVTEPMQAAVYSKKGKLIRELENNEVLKASLSNLTLPEQNFFTFNNPQGISLNGYMIKPLGFDQNKKYPVVMVQYSGPGSQQVVDRYKVDWTSYLASNGYLVVCVDGRGTGARGAEFERVTYMRLGILESQDQISTASYLSTLPYVDAENIAIWGWSFGGYNTLMSMTGSDVFKAGIAVAPVTDWRFYDTIYTERYMRTPEENHEGYMETSVIERSDKLKGNLLIITGTADDNVHPQNTYELTEAFVQDNIQFDMQVYTNRNHFLRGGNTSFHLYTKMVNYLDDKLK